MKRSLVAILCASLVFSSGSFSQSILAAEMTPAEESGSGDSGKISGSGSGSSTEDKEDGGAFGGDAADSMNAAGESSGSFGEGNDNADKGGATSGLDGERGAVSGSDSSNSATDGSGSDAAGGESESEGATSNDALPDGSESTDEALDGEELTEELTEEEVTDLETAEEAEAELIEENEDKEKKSELPEGLNGLPEGYELSSLQKELRANAISSDALDSFEDLTEGEDYAKDELVALTNSREEAENIAYAYSGELLDYSYGVATISISGSELSVGDAFEYSLDENLELPYVEPNYFYEFVDEEGSVEEEETFSLFSSAAGEDVPADNGFSDRWWIDKIQDPYLNPSSSMYQWHHAMINTYSAWGVTTGNKNIVVAVLDSGINSEHIEFANIDASNAYDFYSNDSDVTDGAGHGTHVAGLIAAQINGELGAGVAPGVTILPIKVTTDGGSVGKSDVILSAMRYVSGYISSNKWGDRKADIVNLSMGTATPTTNLETAMNDAYDHGVTIVAAIGNRNGSNLKSFPAAYDHVISVTAVNESGEAAYFSGVGSWADIAAPGLHIYSCNYSNSSGYKSMNGTSQAAPLVSGACALYMSEVGHVEPDVMLKVLKKSVSDSAGADTGAGILDLSKLFAGDTTAPIITLKADDSETDATRTVIGEAESGKSKTISGTVSPDALISFTPMNYGGGDTANENTVIVYTTDGSSPSVFNGNILSGDKYDPEVALTASMLAGEIKVDTKVTVKAAAVTGMGVMGKVTTLIFTAAPTGTSEETSDDGKTVTSINITGQRYMTPGSNYKFAASVSPSTAINKTVEWSIAKAEDGSYVSGVSVAETTGKVTVANSVSAGTMFNVVATAADSGVISQTFEVEVVKKATKVTLAVNNGESSTIATGAQGIYSNVTHVEAIVDNGTAVTFKSSNTKVATVSWDDGSNEATVTAVGKGTCNITATAQDGSKKSASIKITVLQLAEEITVTGQANIAYGNKATFKAAVTPSTANNKKVTWSLAEGSPSGVFINEKTGQVTANSGATGTEVTVVATAVDGSGVKGETTFVLTNTKVTGVTIKADESAVSTDTAKDKYESIYTPLPANTYTDKLTSLRVYSADVLGNDEVENQVLLKSEINNSTTVGTSVGVKWTSSNVKVVAVTKENEDGSALITGLKKGTATITCAAQDGSGKKATVKVTVINPASALYLNSPVGAITTGGSPILTYGSSTKIGVGLGGAYGKATITKASWDYEVGAMKLGASSYTKIKANKSDFDYQQYIKDNKMFFTLSDGKLTVQKTALISENFSKLKELATDKGDTFDYTDGYVPVIKVTATTTDGTGFSDSITYQTLPPASKIYFGKPDDNYQTSYTETLDRNTKGEIVLWTKYEYYAGKEYAELDDLKDDESAYSAALVKYKPYYYTVTSSNPSVATAYVDSSSEYSSKYNAIPIYIYAYKPGTVKFTVTACDGSGKKQTITVKFK